MRASRLCSKAVSTWPTQVLTQTPQEHSNLPVVCLIASCLCTSMNTRTLLRSSVSLLILLSVSLFAWQHFGMNLVLRIDANSPFAITALDDSNVGGNSSTALEVRDNQIHWQCEIGQRYEWPFCELTMTVAPTPQGFDFSRYDAVAIKMKTTGTGSRRMRLFMRNFEHGYSDIHNQLSWKQNELQFDPANDGSETLIPLKALNVASWWLTNNRIPVTRAAVEVTSVSVVQLSTSGIREDRSQTMTIDYLEFRGKRLTRGEVALAIAALWLSAGLIFLLVDFQQKRLALAASEQRQHQLEELNRALTVENERVGTLARLDPLTSALNRAGIRDLLWQESILEHTRKRPLSLLCCDIDYFKRINDNFGHGAGDQVLIEFARLLQTSVRSTDYVVRWGGEEFFLFCPDTSLEAASMLAEKLRSTVEKSSWPHELRITMSVGVATIAHQESLPQFLARADAGLYQAKGNGRNRVEVAPPFSGTS